MNNICAVIPLRLESERFPDKPLAKMNNKTLLEHSISISKKLDFISKIVVASGNDDDRIKRICNENNVDFFYIKENVSCGTERVYYVKQKYTGYSHYMTIPIDEPSIIPEEINKQFNNKKIHSITTLYSDFYCKEDLLSNTSCKILADKNKIIYTSRAIIPVTKKGEPADLSFYKKHVGVFMFPENFIKLNLWTETQESVIESLEQNMFLSKGLYCLKIKHIGIGIDSPEHIEKLEQRLKSNS